MSITHISVRGARQHNLRDINVRIPRNALTVVTGLSGSGKSSLAFDTIYAEGQRRYVETLSAYARQFLDQIERPDVDSIEGLSPAISIEQKTTSRSPRSTVGTITEIYDYLRLLYASVGTPHCPNCGRPIARQTAEQIVQRILELGKGERVTVMAPIVRGRKGEFKDLLDQLDQQGFRARVDGEVRDLSEPLALDRRKNHTIEAIVDRVLLKAAADPVIVGKPRRRKAPRRSPIGPGRQQSLATGQRPGARRLQRRQRAVVFLVHGLPRLRPRRAQARAAQLLLQLHLRRLPQLPRPRLALRLRPRQSHHRLVQAAARRRSRPRLLVAISHQAHPARRRSATRSTLKFPLKICRQSSSTFWSTARPKARRRAPASTASSPTCATTWKKPAATAIAST